MTDKDRVTLAKVYARMVKLPIDANEPDNVIIELEEEIDRYREKIQCMENRINELIRECDALTPKEPAQEFTEERTSDGGTMTIKNYTCYQDIVHILLSNGYFVCCHIDGAEDAEDDTITIEFWRA